MGNLDWLSDNLIELRGPVNNSTGLPVSDLGSPGSAVTAKLYDTAFDCRVGQFETTLTADAAAAATSIFVKDRLPMIILTEIEIFHDDGGSSFRPIATIPGSVGEVTFTSGLDGAASEGNLVVVREFAPLSVTLSLDNYAEWTQGMNMEITVNDGTLIERTPSNIRADLDYFTISSSMTADGATPGNLIKRKIGADLNGFVAFGTFPTTVATTTEGDPTWGFRDVIPHTQADIRPGMRIRGEITLIDDDVSPTLNMTRKVVSTVIKE